MNCCQWKNIKIIKACPQIFKCECAGGIDERIAEFCNPHQFANQRYFYLPGDLIAQEVYVPEFNTKELLALDVDIAYSKRGK